MNGFTEKEIHDLNRMNVSCQNVKLGTSLDKLVKDEKISSFSDKDIKNLNNMNVSCQKVRL